MTLTPSQEDIETELRKFVEDGTGWSFSKSNKDLVDETRSMELVLMLDEQKGLGGVGYTNGGRSVTLHRLTFALRLFGDGAMESAGTLKAYTHSDLPPSDAGTGANVRVQRCGDIQRLQVERGGRPIECAEMEIKIEVQRVYG